MNKNILIPGGIFGAVGIIFLGIWGIATMINGTVEQEYDILTPAPGVKCIVIECAVDCWDVPILMESIDSSVDRYEVVP